MKYYSYKQPKNQIIGDLLPPKIKLLLYQDCQAKIKIGDGINFIEK